MRSGLMNAQPPSSLQWPIIIGDSGIPMHHIQRIVRTVVLRRDGGGYGLTVSGENPVYVIDVREGGVAARAGVCKYDVLLQVNGTPVREENHHNVVGMIKSEEQVTLTLLSVVQPEVPTAVMPSNPSLPVPPPLPPPNPTHSSPPSRPLPPPPESAAPSTTSRALEKNITGPQPVDVEQLRQVNNQKERTISMMLEREMLHRETVAADLVEQLRQVNNQKERTISMMLEREMLHRETVAAELQKTVGGGRRRADLQRELTSADRRIRQLNEELRNFHSRGRDLVLGSSNSPPMLRRHSSREEPNGEDMPPPLPARNRLMTRVSSPALSTLETPAPPPVPPHRDEALIQKASCTSAADAKKIGNGMPSHQRAKSSPDHLGTSHSAENLSSGTPSVTSSKPVRSNSDFSGSNKLNSSESMGDLPKGNKQRPRSLVGQTETSPPNTPVGRLGHTRKGSEGHFSEGVPGGSRPAPSPILTSTPEQQHCDSKVPLSVSPPQVIGTSPWDSSNSPVLNFGTNQILSFEEESGGSDSEVCHMTDDHGPFNSLSKLMDHNAHLAVFLNYLLNNSDASSLFFHIITDFYKEGNVKEMRKWVYEIHSTFLVPNAPLRLAGVDENVLHEIDNDIQNNLDKEEKLKNIFWRAKKIARGQLRMQLADFRNKRVEGLAHLFGATDAQLDECLLHKEKEAKVIEPILLPVIKELDDLDNLKGRDLAMAYALATVLAKQYGLKSPVVNAFLERCPTFVSKDKSFRSKILSRGKKQLSLLGHHFIPQQFSCVTYCNHCTCVIWGIGPQGYQCTHCELNVHKWCVREVEEDCVGAMHKPDKKSRDRISNFFRLSDWQEGKRKPSHLSASHIEKARLQWEEKEENSSLGSAATDSAAGRKKNRIFPPHVLET
ncbi:unnamed protein product [Darwinula stevensoni]|uniref:Uncharacterized protein n=1 Tax=Darwinula stevensoni TaxID=69355 RepID=A0A7R8XAS2_9CRUS|nr:unnamed protein product [Darwinula stevensoni]CAG0890291.1 unnamed protein product [Darwinula stevensoni]